jgi:hypothetical protein
MLTSSFCGDLESPDYRNKEYVLDILGHVNIGVTRNVYGKGWWEERVDAATQVAEGVTISVDISG